MGGTEVTKKALRRISGLPDPGVHLHRDPVPTPDGGRARSSPLLHDLIITAGVYAWVGFEVTPSTVVGLLTILGFSLYDTVVVFDKVAENTKDLTAGSRMTYSEGANLAVNQTLMRSINTSLISLLPVAGLLFVGAGLLGVGTIKDLALILFVGLAAGAYSSLFWPLRSCAA